MQKIVFLALAIVISTSASAQIVSNCNPLAPGVSCPVGTKFKQPRKVHPYTCIGIQGCNPACASCYAGNCYCSTCCVSIR